MDRLTGMSVFVRVVELGGFAAAAAELGLSATMVGKHVRAIEQRLGTRVLNRTTRRQSLTGAGQVYYERCKQLIADVEEAESSANELGAEPRGRLRVTSPVSFGARRLAPALAEFLEAYPAIAIDLMLNDRFVDLVEDGVDVAIRIGPLVDSGLIARPLRPYRSMVCAAPSYLAKNGRPRIPEDLGRHECLGFTHWRHRDRWRFKGPVGEHTVRIAGRMQIDNGEGLRNAALAGLGIVMQPEVLLADDVQRGDLVRLLPRFEPPSQPMHLIYLREHRPTRKRQCLVEFLVKRFGM